MKLIIIGIHGTTCSGKTTISKKVQESLKDSILIKQDDYFLPEDDPKHVLVPEVNHYNWEILSSLDMSKMYSDIMDIIASTSKSSNIQKNETCNKFKFLILEGFLILNYKPIADLCHQKYFIHSNKELCWERRSKRVYNPPDCPGYFEKVVWPEYLKHKSKVLSDENLCKNIKFLNGSKSIDELYNEVMNGIKSLLY